MTLSLSLLCLASSLFSISLFLSSLSLTLPRDKCLFVSLSIYLSVSLLSRSYCLFVYLSFFPLSLYISQSILMPVYLSRFVCLNIYLSICIALCLSTPFFFPQISPSLGLYCPLNSESSLPLGKFLNDYIYVYCSPHSPSQISKMLDHKPSTSRLSLSLSFLTTQRL